MRILVSACLLGVNCKYSGESNFSEDVLRLSESHELIPVCPEQLGGLPTPREPSEIRGDCVIARSGADVTAQYRRGAAETLRIAQLFGCKCAVLKERSPSCGSGTVYDGTFSHTLTDGDGVTAAFLAENGIKIYGESEISELFELK